MLVWLEFPTVWTVSVVDISSWLGLVELALSFSVSKEVDVSLSCSSTLVLFLELVVSTKSSSEIAILTTPSLVFLSFSL